MKIEIPKGQKLEFAVAKAVDGKEEQLFGEYFPKVGPIVAEYGGRPVGSFEVLKADGLKDPGFGVLFLWPSMQAYNDFHKDARFQALKHLRDEALEFLTNAHFFDTDALDLELPNEALVVAIGPEGAKDAQSYFALPAAADSTNQDYLGQTLSLAPASDDAASGATAHCHIRFNA